jgi:dTDP-4-dehydrorhamnose reductase
MRIYVLGCAGMLGHRLFINFLRKSSYVIRGSTRKIPKILRKYNKYIDINLDANNILDIKKKIKEFKPNLVINCIGVIKQKNLCSKNIFFYTNSIFPHELNKICIALKSKLIHFSTDCVFNGKKGNYSEDIYPNAIDIYGLSKKIGELSSKNSITLRTSIIGHEINSSQGLLEWFLKKKKQCLGFDKFYFSGFPTDEIFNILLIYIIPNIKKLYGIYHLSSEKISKYKLLKLISKIYSKNIRIVKSDKIKIDRSLDSCKLKKLINYKPPSWTKLVKNMYCNKNFF